MSAERIPCPYCGESNVQGSNVCGRCLRNIRKVANREAEDFVETVFTAPPRPSLWRRLKRWLRRQRNR
jgi:sarcosine oxidase delta subunit